MTDSTMPTILGSSQSSVRSRPRPRYSYPVSATEWTEYNSPLANAKNNFVVNVVGDRSRQSRPSCNEMRNSSGVFPPKHLPAATAPVAPANNVSAIEDAQPGVPDVPVIKLSTEQQHVLDLVRSGRKYVLIFFPYLHMVGLLGVLIYMDYSLVVFSLRALQVISLSITSHASNIGRPGTGKSVLLREIINLLRTNPSRGVAITASTGIAGLNIGGSTIHSFAGIGLGKESAEVLAKRISKSKFPRIRWRSISTLIIDESKCNFVAILATRRLKTSKPLLSSLYVRRNTV